MKTVSVLVLLLGCVLESLSGPLTVRRGVNPAETTFNATQLINTVKELTKEPGKFRRVATISLLLGAIRTEAQMEKELSRLTDDLLDNFDDIPMPLKEKKISEISKFVQRDLRAMFILSSAIDLTQYNASVEAFRDSMKEFTLHAEELSPKLDRDILKNGKSPKETIRSFVNEHIQILRSSLRSRVVESVAALQKSAPKSPGAMRPIYVASLESVDSNSVNGQEAKAKDEGKDSKGEKKKCRKIVCGNVFQSHTSEISQVGYIPHQVEILNHLRTLERDRRGDDGGMEMDEEAGPGGLVGLIANLSGGEEGSDVGAVLGAITGVVARLLGPGGLDINGLLSTGTSLVAGLLGGDENFGTVLARYIGTSLDGFSGGGGADKNGLFVGNLVGGVISALSADPDDEDENPIKPGIFLQNMVGGVFQALAKKPMGAQGRNDGDDMQAESAGAGKRMMSMEHEAPSHSMGGSDVFGFIIGLIKAVVGGVKSIVVNTVAGLSSGASKGSADLGMKVAAPLSMGSDGLAAQLTT